MRLIPDLANLSSPSPSAAPLAIASTKLKLPRPHPCSDENTLLNAHHYREASSVASTAHCNLACVRSPCLLRRRADLPDQRKCQSAAVPVAACRIALRRLLQAGVHAARTPTGHHLPTIANTGLGMSPARSACRQDDARVQADGGDALADIACAPWLIVTAISASLAFGRPRKPRRTSADRSAGSAAPAWFRARYAGRDVDDATTGRGVLWQQPPATAETAPAC